MKLLSAQLSFLFLIAICFATSSISQAQSVQISDGPKAIQPGETYTVVVKSNQDVAGIVQAQLFDANWKRVAEKWKPVETGGQQTDLGVEVPSEAKEGEGYFWQVVLYNAKWEKQKEVIVDGVVISAADLKPSATKSEKPNSMASEKTETESAAEKSSEWTPEGQWEIVWQDEFDSPESLDNWFPFLGYTPDEFANKSEKGIRWNGKTESSAQMYSAKSGQHRLNGNGQLVLEISTDKKKSNDNGPQVQGAYLMSGFPEKWDKSEPTNVKWKGKFFSAADAPRYIAARIKTNQLRSHSTWFAFWLFSETRAYNGNPADGTEVDIVEIPKGKKPYLNKAFNVANHWEKNTKGSESLQINEASTPKSTDLVDVNDDRYHVYGVQWSKTQMKCYVDGKLYYTFTENIPTEPVDMMVLLTMEFQKNAWDPDQGDGRTEGPFVSEDENKRVMSRVLVDYVREYKQSDPKK